MLPFRALLYIFIIGNANKLNQRLHAKTMIPIPSLEIPHCDSPPSFSTDHFRMFQFKVRSCPRGRSHDWTECPYAHPAEKARRRDPRKFHYSGTACPDYRKGNCKRGNTCQFAHGVFECWLHPSRSRTQLCKDGTNCCRRVCFFAHTNDQLRLVTSDSPYGLVLSVGEIINSTRNEYSVFGFINLNGCEEEPAMERVESGKDIRARIYAKLSRENSIGASVSAPDIGWVSELGSL